MADWTQVEILTSTSGIEVVSAMLASLNLGSIAIRDAADFKTFVEQKTVPWDYIDDELMEELTTGPTIVTVYLAQMEQGEEQLRQMEQELVRLRAEDTGGEWGPLTVTVHTVKEEDWATAWKQYYHPLEIGRRLIVCPTWEECTPREEQVVLRMDPGMAFGTGTHESTRLCLEILDDISTGGERVLDIGCGSGILSIAAMLLGGAEGDGVDIDQVAVGVAQENAAENNLSQKLSYKKGSFTQHATGRYEIVFANIVADAILQLAPAVPGFLAPGGSFITSGIIDTRAEEVKTGLEQAGLVVVETREDDGWVAFRAVEKGE